MNEIKKPTDNLRKLILLCLENIKGMTKSEEIENLLPINSDHFQIEKGNNNIEIYLNNKLEKIIWKDTECYMNIEILKAITKDYGITLESEDIVSLMKYKNKVTLMLL